jgi:hypothetical protein
MLTSVKIEHRPCVYPQGALPVAAASPRRRMNSASGMASAFKRTSLKISYFHSSRVPAGHEACRADGQITDRSLDQEQDWTSAWCQRLSFLL